jgi:desampylase
VRLPRRVEAALLSQATAAAPEECCGLLLGDATTIVDVIPARNSADDPLRRYVVDPRDYFRAIREARARALEVIGAYHSHPQSSAAPSDTDRAQAFSHFVFLIVGLGSTPPDVSAWTWSAGNFTPLPLVRTL